ncbi:MAG: permease, partial [Candidatus Krumholzibacteriales bacterium]
MKKNAEHSGLKRDMIFLAVVFIIAIALVSLFPERRSAVKASSWKFLVEMIWILPGVMVLMGLFMVWVPEEMVEEYLGKASGAKGVSLSILFGALPTGPLYVAFPLALSLMKKGARISNVIIFLSAWGCIKIPQEMVELNFLGAGFMFSRLVLTIVFVVIMGVSIEKIIE